jgi:plastocyanin
MKLMTAAVLLAFAGGSVAALAADRTISQKGRAFSETEITVKKGENIVFVNDDNIAHNIMSASAGNEFNLGSQAPGASSSVALSKAGEVSVVCAIHPRMKMTVTVAD